VSGMLTELKRGPRVASGDLLLLLLECHGRIRSFVALADAIANRHEAPAAQVIQACASVERYFTEALPLHVADEEQSLAPRLRGRSCEIDRALIAMERQHREHDSKLAALLLAVAAVSQAPERAAPKRDLGRVIELVRADFEQHLALEEALIIPAARSLLSVELRAAILVELRQRRARVA